MPWTKYSPLICEQPKHATMDLTSTAFRSEEISRCHNHVCVNGGPQDVHQNSRLRRFIFPTALAAFVLLAGLFAFSCSQGYAPGWGLLSRDVTGTSSSTFVKNKCSQLLSFSVSFAHLQHSVSYRPSGWHSGGDWTWYRTLFLVLQG
jgi:hypothetical protein